MVRILACEMVSLYGKNIEPRCRQEVCLGSIRFGVGFVLIFGHGRADAAFVDDGVLGGGWRVVANGRRSLVDWRGDRAFCMFGVGLV